MKRLIREILFWDSPAQGAFFGLTLLFSVPWFWLVWIFRNNDTILNLWISGFSADLLVKCFGAIPIFILLLILIYAAFLCARISPQAWRNPNHRAKRYLTAAGGLLSLSCAAFIFWVIIKTLYAETAYTLYEHACRDTDIADRIGLHGNGWGWFAFAGMMLWATSYFLIGKIISWSTAVRCCKLIGKSVLALWSLLATSYVFCVVMALNATVKYHVAVAELSRYFGRPLTATALAEVYQNGRKPDAAFWSTVEALKPNFPEFDYSAEQSAGFDRLHSSIVRYPDAILPETVYSEWKTRFLGNENLRKLAKMLEQPLPPAERPYRDDKLLSQMLLPELTLCRELVRLEYWQLKFALEDGDIQAVRQALQRVENICTYQQNDTLMISSLVWIALEHMRHELISKVVSSKMVETDWLIEQSRNLSDLEDTVHRIQRMSIYGEAVFAVNTMEYSPYKDQNEFGGSSVKLSTLRWILPHAWWNVARNAEGLVRAYMISDWSEFPDHKSDNLFISMQSGTLRTIGTRKFPAAIADLRILRGLIEAELIKRKDGSYPKQMNHLLLDPFSGEPLRYKKGACVVSVPVFKKTGPNADSVDMDEASLASEPEYKMIMEQRSIEAVQIWSIGPDRIDDGGIQNNPEYGSEEKAKDDLRLIIRLE